MYKLGNMNEFKKLTPLLNEEIKDNNVFELIEIKNKLSLSFEEEVSFISQNFYYFYQNYHDKLINLESYILEQIFSKSELKVSSEDMLLKFILELYEKSTNYSTLLGYVLLVNITKDAMNDFISKFDYNYINHKIWDQICNYLSYELSNESKRMIISRNKELFEHRYDNFSGNIIQDFISKFSPNELNQKLKITTSKCVSNLKPENVLTNDEHFCRIIGEPRWICFEFCGGVVSLHAYKLKSGNASPPDHIKSWKLEGSIDGKHWETLDEQNDCSKLNGKLNSATFRIGQYQPVRYIRLLQIGQSWRNQNIMELSSIELIGDYFLINH